MFKNSDYKHVNYFFVLACSALLVDQASAIDVREKLIVRAYNCSDFSIDATISRPLLPFEFPSHLGPHAGRLDGGRLNGGFSGARPVVGGQGGGLFGVPSRQGLRGGGGRGGNAPAPPKPQVREESVQASTITYHTKDLTEITNLIYESVDPKSWGVGHARPKIRKLDSILVITQTQKNHDEIQKLLTMLREARKQ